jgi:hypothetical protein
MPEALAQEKFSCPTCGGELIQKSKARLCSVGIAMIASLAIAFWFPMLWVPTILFALIGCYLLIWATAGQALWCRSCKKFGLPKPVSKRD